MAEQLFDGYEKWINQYISRQRRRQITYLLSLAGIVVASFLAFNDVYLELQTTQRQLAETQEKLVAKGPEEQVKAIVRLQADNRQLETDLHSTQQTLSALQQSLQARRLSQEERQKLTSVLAAHEGQQSGDLYIAAFPSCHECMTYVYELATAINSVPSWTAQPMVNILLKVDFSGIGVGVRDSQSPPSTATILVEALKAAGISYTIESLSIIGPDACMLVVGNKP
jgi:hypothetical protein